MDANHTPPTGHGHGPDPGIARLADQAAVRDHDDQDATSRHELIASALWPALRGLGVAGGRMFVWGEDPEVYAGVRADDRRLPHATMSELTGTIAGPARPPTGLRLRRPGESENRFDLVILNTPLNDVVLRDPANDAHHRRLQVDQTLGSILLARPGGIIVVLAGSQLLDHPDPQPRHLIARGAELLGAVRLPAGALRNTPGNDGPVDLLLLRRHEHDTPPATSPHMPQAGPAESVGFVEAVQVTRDGRAVHLSAYYDCYPDRVLGTLTSQDNPWGPPTTTVLPEPGGFQASLAQALRDITTTARGRGLAATDTTGPDLDAPIPYLHPEGHQGPNLPTETRVADLDDARRVVARLRGQRRPPRAPGGDTDRPAQGTDPDGPSL